MGFAFGNIGGPQTITLPVRDYQVDDLGNRVGGSIFEDLVKPQIPDYKEYIPPNQPQQPQQPQGEEHKQYIDAMRKNIDGLSEAFKQIENMQMPGGQHGGPGGQRQGGSVGKGVATLF